MAPFEPALAQIHSMDQRVLIQSLIRAALIRPIHPHEPVGTVLHRHALESRVDARVQDVHRPLGIRREANAGADLAEAGAALVDSRSDAARKEAES